MQTKNVSQLMLDKMAARVGSLSSQVVYLESHLEIANDRIRELEKSLASAKEKVDKLEEHNENMKELIQGEE